MAGQAPQRSDARHAQVGVAVVAQQRQQLEPLAQVVRQPGVESHIRWPAPKCSSMQDLTGRASSPIAVEQDKLVKLRRSVAQAFTRLRIVTLVSS